MNTCTAEDSLCSTDTGNDFSICDVLVRPFAHDDLDFVRLIGAARHGRDSALSSLRTLARLMRRAGLNGSDEDGLMGDVGLLVAHLSDYADAMTSLASHASYRQECLALHGRTAEGVAAFVA